MAVVTVNGVVRELTPVPSGMLIGFLRNTLGLTGAKPGCGEGECGACTVLVDGTPVLSCRTPTSDVVGTTVTTVEGLAAHGRLHPVQEALMENHAAQCGYCLPGMALRAAALLEADPDPLDADIDGALAPNLCRCGGYLRIRHAVHDAAALRKDLQSGSGAAGPGSGPYRGAKPGPVRRPRRPWDLTPPDERDHLAVVGPGLVCVWPPRAHSPGAWGGGGAWVHVAPSGQVTAFSGKVDVGQDNGTAFRLLVAEELRASFDDVQVVQGDTDLCPYDVGTFASRSMPDSGEPLRRAAAGARQILEEIGGPGQLDDGCRLVVLGPEPALVAPRDRRLVGRRGHEASALDALTGRRRYVSDLDQPNMGHGAMLRPPTPGATLRSVDVGPAARMAGVTVVHDGSFVGAVADDPATARGAVEAIVATWDMPPPFDDDLVGYLRSHPADGEGWEHAVDETVGDLESALSSAVTLLEATYTTAYLAHVPLETRAALAAWSGGRLTVWTGSQVPFGVRAHVAGALGVDEADVRVVVPPTGSAFGGKHGGEVAVEAARLSRGAGRPVLVHWNRTEELRWGTLRPLTVVDVRAGLRADGTLAAWDFLDVNGGSAALGPPYPAGASRLRSQPARSPLRQGSYRALGANANNFARESAIDELAAARGSDPLAFRLDLLDDDRLAAVLRAATDRFGWVTSPSPSLSPSPSPSPRAVGATTRGPHTGSGLAVGREKGGRVATCAEVRVDTTGRVTVLRLVVAYECGTVVNPDTVTAQIEGGVIMALGGALMEAVPVDHGQFAHPSLARYPVPRFGDVPPIEVVLVDRPDQASAGAGETPMIAVAPAVANAIFAASGRRLRRLPLIPAGRLV